MPRNAIAKGSRTTIIAGPDATMTVTTAAAGVGAINGAAITGGMEMALGCDFLVVSDRAVFADTHARVGILPGAGMTARLSRR